MTGLVKSGYDLKEYLEVAKCKEYLALAKSDLSKEYSGLAKNGLSKEYLG